MSLFGNMKSDGLEETEDRLGGFSSLETDIYTGVIKQMYAGQSAAGARSITILFDHDGKEYRETVYITNKNGENFFLNKDKDGKPTGKKVPLPGFTIIDEICLVTNGKPLCDQAHEEKMVKVYDPDAKKELPKSVPVLIDLLGQTVSLAIVKVLENKSVKDGNGAYQPTADERESNVIEKVFHTETKMTVPEARQGAEAPTFYNAWLERNKGKTRDKRSIKDGQGGNTGRTGKLQGGPPQAAGQQATARKSLFGGK